MIMSLMWIVITKYYDLLQEERFALNGVSNGYTKWTGDWLSKQSIHDIVQRERSRKELFAQAE